MTAALGCILVMAVAGEICLKIDVKWYSALVKPVFMPSAFGFSVLVTLVYACCAAVITRLVVKKKFFPYMAALALSGELAALYLSTVFRMKSLYGGAVVILLLFAVSFFTEVRFAAEDRLLAVSYFPVLVFNGFCLVLSFVLALSN